jgi:hypothetical protein
VDSIIKVKSIKYPKKRKTMKRNIIITGIVAAAIMVMVFACSKENATDKPVTKHELTAYETHINKTLKDFKQKMEYLHANPHLKSGESVPTDSAVWLLEATINFSHAFPNEFYSEFEIDSLTLVVERNADGTVDMNELTSKYDEMKQAVADAYHNSGYEVKGLTVVDLTETTVTENEIIINVQVITGSRGVDPGPGGFGINGPFAEGDDWWYGETLGGCNPHTGETDAAEQLFIAMNNYIASQNVNVGFVSITERIIKGGTTNAFGRLFSTFQYNGIPFNEYQELCMDWQDMNIHYNDMKYLIYTKLQLESVVPPGYKPESITTFLGDHQTVSNGIHYYHEYTFKFGYPINRGDDGPEEL